MHPHVWYKRLRELNPRLRVCMFEGSNNLPGIYYVDEREGIVDVCATDKNWVPATPVFDSTGRLVKSGYRRVIFILLHAKLTTREKVRKVFGQAFFEQRYPRPTPVQTASVHQKWSEMMKHERARFNILGDAKQVDVQDKTMDKMKQMEMDNYNKRSSAALSGDQFVELAADLKKDMPDEKKENLERAKFDYDRAMGKGKVSI